MGEDNLSNEQLMALIVSGDTAAYEMLYDRYSSMVMGLALRMTGDRAMAEDVVQETFWRVWSKADSFDNQRGAFTSWFFGIARNLSVDMLRRRTMRPQQTDETESMIELIADPKADVAEIALLGAKHQQVRAAVATLPVEQRYVIEMAFFNGMTRQEIAQATGEPLGTIHTRARLALQKLREELRFQGFDE